MYWGFHASQWRDPATGCVGDVDGRVVLTNLKRPKEGFPGGGTIYAFGCRVEIDGQPMMMIRYVPVQASFYEPYIVDGVRIWLDGVREIGKMFNESHGACVPRKAARFALQDATLPICAEEELRPWYPNAGNRIDARACYNGDDVWMGTYFGRRPARRVGHQHADRHAALVADQLR